MGKPDPGPGLVLLIVLLGLDAVIYGFRSALHAYRAMHPDAGKEAEHAEEEKDAATGRNKAERLHNLIEKILQDQSDYLDTVQISTALINLILGAVYGMRFTLRLQSILMSHSAYLEGHSLLAEAASAVIVFPGLLIVTGVLGVQIPQRLAAHHPDEWIHAAGRLFRVILIVFLPLVRLISAVSGGILYLFGVRGQALKGDVTEEEIRSIVNEGHEQGVIEQTEAQMITNIFEFSDKEAENVMTHRNDMVCLDGAMELHDAIRFMLNRHNSRFPVYTGNIDNIRGILHFRDAIRYREEHPQDAHVPVGEIREILREPIFVPETKNIDDLFQQMQKKKAQMVIVIDEYGQTSGLVAMEDILEEIVGNIMDEYDVDESHITPTGNKNDFIAEGRTELSELSKRFGITFDDDRFETLNGFLISRMDHIPEANEHFTCEVDGFRFRVLSAADRQIQRVLVTRLAPARGSRTAPQ